MCLSYTYFIASILRDIDINPVKSYQLKQNSAQIYLLIQTYVDQTNCSANNLTGFYIIWGSFGKGTLEQAMTKFPYGTTPFRVIGVLENKTSSLKIICEKLFFLVKLHTKTCNFTKSTRSLRKFAKVTDIGSSMFSKKTTQAAFAVHMDSDTCFLASRCWCWWGEVLYHTLPEVCEDIIFLQYSEEDLLAPS